MRMKRQYTVDKTIKVHKETEKEKLMSGNQE